MYGKLLFVVGLGVGYVVGTSRGRKDYEMLRQRASEIWLDPRVQWAAKQATDAVEKNVPICTRTDETCPQYRPNDDAMFVLEIAGGTVDGYKIEKGSRLQFSQP